MEAKETVLNKGELTKINNAMPSEAKYGDVFQAIAEHQAELSFKAGEEQGELKGINKVMEWLNNKRAIWEEKKMIAFWITEGQWEAQLAHTKKELNI